MTREAEAEAWIRKPKRIIHNQTLMQLLNVLVFIVPLPLTALFFWALFDLGSPIVVQTVAVLWGSSTVIYGASALHVRIKRRNP